MNAIESDGLARVFGRRRVVDGLSFSVEPGEVFGFLGPNGAGKTTTLRMLTGQLIPTSGRARVAGCDVVQGRAALKPRIGVVFEQQNLYERFSGRENLAFFGQLYGVSGRCVNQALERVKLSDRAGERVSRYSNGMKQRLVIARALLHGPQVLFLDEPTRGLDPHAARDLRALIAELAAQGTTVFLTTHYMEEADHLCRRVAFLNEGRIVALDTPQRLKTAHGPRQVRVLLDDGQALLLALDNPGDGARLGELAGAGRVLTMHSAEATLEEVFVKLTGRKLQ
jgi:ABC-2 type transport system ATP-binding protein